MLRQVLPKILQYESKRFDPTIPGDVVMGTDIDMDGLMSLLVAWREDAWDNAVLLATAPNDIVRNAVAATIETQAATEANALKAASRPCPRRRPPATPTARRTGTRSSSRAYGRVAKVDVTRSQASFVAAGCEPAWQFTKYSVAFWKAT